MKHLLTKHLLTLPGTNDPNDWLEIHDWGDGNAYVEINNPSEYATASLKFNHDGCLRLIKALVAIVTGDLEDEDAEGDGQ